MKISSDVLEELRPDPVALDPAWSHEVLTRVLSERRSRDHDATRHGDGSSWSAWPSRPPRSPASASLRRTG